MKSILDARNDNGQLRLSETQTTFDKTRTLSFIRMKSNTIRPFRLFYLKYDSYTWFLKLVRSLCVVNEFVVRCVITTTPDFIFQEEM